MTNRPSDEELVRAATDAGWLLEVEALKTLEVAGYTTIQGWAYQDPDDDTKSRELDAFGWRRFLEPGDSGVTVGSRVLVECKQSSSPLAFIGRRRGLNPWPTQENHAWPYRKVGLPVVGRPGSVMHAKAWSTLGFDDIPSSPALDDFRAGQMTKLQRNNKGWLADNAGIFESLVMPLAKALRASHANVRPSQWAYEHDADPPPSRSVVAALHFPVVLTSAQLLCIDATDDAPIVTAERWCSVERHLETANTSGRFLIDVVNHEHFADYLSERVGAFTSGVADRVRANPRLATHAQPGMEYDGTTGTVVHP